MKNQTCLNEFIRYCVLNILGMIGLSCYILADTFFISKGMGADGLTALNLALPVYSLIHGSGLMLGMGGATKYSLLRGLKSHVDADRTFTSTLCVAAVLAMIFVSAGIFFSQELTGLLGADRGLFSMTNTYLKVILLFAPAFLANDILICFVRNDGNPKLAMLAMLGGSMSNILLDYIFIFPMSMGMFGAVFATGLAPVFSMLILSQHFLKKRNQFHIARPLASMTVPILSLGFPSLITEVSSGIVILVFNTIILGLRGNTGVAAYGVIANLSLVVIAVFTGLAQGMQPLSSQYFGQGQHFHVKQVLRYAVTAALFLSVIIYAATFFFAGQITGIFNSQGNIELQEIAVSGLKLYFIAVPFAALNIVLSVFFTSIGKALPAHLISLLRGLIIILPMAFLLSSLAGMTGVWLTFPVTEGIVAGIALGCVIVTIYLSKMFPPQ